MDLKDKIKGDATTRDLKEKKVMRSSGDEKLKLLTIRLKPSDIERLRRHFDSQGLNLTAGLRMVIKKELNKLS